MGEWCQASPTKLIDLLYKTDLLSVASFLSENVQIDTLRVFLSCVHDAIRERAKKLIKLWKSNGKDYESKCYIG